MSVRSMFTERRDDVAMYARGLYYLLLDHQWAHVQGPNLAMVDGLELGVMLADTIDGEIAWRSARLLLP